MNKQFLSYLSTATLSQVYHALLQDKADLRAITKISAREDYDYIKTALETIEELRATIAEVVVGDRGEIL